MNDPFKHIIDQDREAFDTQMPPADMWARIEAAQDKPARILRFTPALRAVAAIVVVALVATIGWKILQNRQVAAPSMELSAIDTEVMEAANFYENQITQKQQQVFQLTSHQPVVRQGVEQDMAELDKALTELKLDLKDNIANAEVLDAMIQTYRMKLDILEQILSYLQPAETDQQDSKQTDYDL